MLLLAVSGSLRRTSTNTSLLNAAIRLAPNEVQIKLYNGLNDLPHYNYDLEENEPHEVKNFRNLVKQCDGLIVSSPEYAHGVPGALKNALDWLVGSDAFINKPVTLFNASSRSVYAQASLIETINAMAGIVIKDAFITLPLIGKSIDMENIISGTQYSDKLSEAIKIFVSSIKKLQDE